MKECIECGKNLGIIEGYRHPTIGRDYLLCRNCFDTIFESIEKYREFIAPYIGYFNKEKSKINDIQKIGDNITKNIKKMQNRVNNLWLQKTPKNINDTIYPL